MKLWFSIFDENRYKGNELSFYDPIEFEWAQTILRNKTAIINEFNTTINSEKLFDPYFNYLFSSTDGGWKTIGLKFWSINNYKNQKYFPKITEIFNSIPEILSVSFSKLEPNSEIIPHCGDTNGIFRCHFGINIPGDLPHCGFQVEDEQKSWENGGLLVFCDALYHTAWNKTSEDRYIMIFDVIRKEANSQRKKVVSTVLASMLLQKIGLKFKWGLNDNFKRKKLKPVVFLLRPFAHVAVWVTNYFKIY